MMYLDKLCQMRFSPLSIKNVSFITVVSNSARFQHDLTQFLLKLLSVTKWLDFFKHKSFSQNKHYFQKYLCIRFPSFMSFNDMKLVIMSLNDKYFLFSTKYGTPCSFSLKNLHGTLSSNYFKRTYPVSPSTDFIPARLR